MRHVELIELFAHLVGVALCARRPSRAEHRRRPDLQSCTFSSARSRTALLVDADHLSIDTIERGFEALSQKVGRVRAFVFAEPGRLDSKKWAALFRREEVRFVPVSRNMVHSEPNDAAITAHANMLCKTPTVSNLALLTQDAKLQDHIAEQARDHGMHLYVLIINTRTSSERRGVLENLGADVVPVALQREVPLKVQAYLRKDGNGAVVLRDSLSISGIELIASSEAVRQLLCNTGHCAEEDDAHQATVKFWYWHAINLSCDSLGTVYLGGGPFILPDSENLTLEMLSRLNYLDDDLNKDVQEAMFLFVNGTRNRTKLKKLGLLPAPEDGLAAVSSKLRQAFVSNCARAHWQLAPRDGTMRRKLCAEGLIMNTRVPNADVNKAMTLLCARSYPHGLRMKTYNGLVWFLGREMLFKDDPQFRGIVAVLGNGSFK